MNYLDDVIRQHSLAKESFGVKYEFHTKQSDIIHLSKVALQNTVKKRNKTQRHIEKTKRDIEKLYKHLLELEDKLVELTDKEDDDYNFLQTVLFVREEDVWKALL